MEIITKNNRKYYRFKIGDEFSYISFGTLISTMNNNLEIKGITPTLNNLKKVNWTQINQNSNFKFPFYDSSTKNQHIAGYSKYYNFSNIGIKVSELGGYTQYINKKSFIGKNAGVIVSNGILEVNHFLSSFFNKLIPTFSQGTTQKRAMWSYYKNEYIEIPTNHEELSRVIKRILEYKQISKQMKDYKLAILQESEKSIKHWKETNQHDKYITFKIGDEFKAISGKGSYNAMLKEGLCSDTYNEEQGFIYPFYDASTKNNHIKGYCKMYNNDSKGFKVSVTGNKRITNSGLLDPTPAGSTVFVKGKKYIAEKAMILENNDYTNNFTSEIFNKWLPNFSMGALNMHNCYYSYYCDEKISLPNDHNELSKKIEQLNKWQIKVEETVKQMEEYIEGILQMSLK